MKLFRNPGMIIAVFWCAAMIIAPMAAAAGACPGMNPRAGQGNNQLQQGPAAGPGNTLNPQGDGQNTITPVQGSRPQGPGKRNMTESANRTLFAPDDGNITTPHGKPDRDPTEMAALNKTAVHGHGAMNMTDMNMTDIPPSGDFAPATMTTINQTWHGHGNGNRTLPPPLPGSSDTPGQQAPVNQQEAQSQKNAGTSLIDELITWLKAHGVS